MKMRNLLFNLGTLLLVSMLRGDKRSAVDIAKDRISKHDSGGFSSGGKTFFERALALNDA